MPAQYIKLGLLFLSLYCYSSQYQPGEISSGVAQAFLFHQLHPITLPASSPYSGYYENSSSSSQDSNFNSNSEHPQNRLINTNRAAPPNDQHHFAQDSTNQDSRDTTQNGLYDCPKECLCNKAAQTVDCSNRNLDRVPSGFSKDIKRIRLERNNITELGPYAFQGLKRLHRIDLSNNNLMKIDPLAFAGGLQSLNSLILYSNKLNQLPTNLFSELPRLELLLLNANSIQCINKELFQPLSNLNLLSLYDNKIEILTNGTFDGLKNIKTLHLGKNPLVCDCNLRWLADYLELNPAIETSEARCESPQRNQGKKLSQINKQKFKCDGNEQGKTSQIANQCAALNAAAASPPDQSCPPGCACSGSTVDCSKASWTESRAASGTYELPDISDDVPIFVTRVRINDTRIKRIRQTQLFRRLTNSQKIDLGNNKIVDIEDNVINGIAGHSTKPERVVFVLLESQQGCDSATKTGVAAWPQQQQQNKIEEDACASAPRVNSPTFDSPCYNGGSCVNGLIVGARSRAQQQQNSVGSVNYSCICPPGFTGSLCEINIDDCLDHQCQNGAMCVDGVNSYKCICRDPTTTGEFCEQLSPLASSSISNSIAPIALPMIASSNAGEAIQSMSPQSTRQQQILTRSADLAGPLVDLTQASCKRKTQKKYYEDGNGCQSVRVLKISECAGSCGTNGSPDCCLPAKVKHRRIRMQCSDGASYVKTIELVKKCACSSECAFNFSQRQQSSLANQFNATQEDQLLQITRLDAVD